MRQKSFFSIRLEDFLWKEREDGTSKTLELDGYNIHVNYDNGIEGYIEKDGVRRKFDRTYFSSRFRLEGIFDGGKFENILRELYSINNTLSKRDMNNDPEVRQLQHLVTKAKNDQSDILYIGYVDKDYNDNIDFFVIGGNNPQKDPSKALHQFLYQESNKTKIKTTSINDKLLIRLDCKNENLPALFTCKRTGDKDNSSKLKSYIGKGYDSSGTYYHIDLRSFDKNAV